MRYKEHIDKQPMTLELVPLMHTCDGIGFLGIIESQEISATLCPVFNESLVYYFYGRPAYRVKESSCSSMIELFPVCFIIKPESLDALKRVYPFDTGAFEADLYQQHMSSKMPMQRFELKPSYDFIKKFVEYIYGSNSNYYKGRSILDASSLSPLYTEIQSLLRLVNYTGAERIDDRCSTIEVQTEKALDITSGAIQAIIMPSEMLADESVSDLLMDHDIEPITYEVYRSSPSAMTNVILNKTSEYLSLGGAI
ncbi:hypothetical protein [Shewanella sp.]|uniref:hypothetical protein n=1 Tax=Shewanella sp. TaxID=50422 RepID=UPI0035669F0A